MVHAHTQRDKHFVIRLPKSLKDEQDDKLFDVSKALINLFGLAWFGFESTMADFVRLLEHRSPTRGKLKSKLVHSGQVSSDFFFC